MSATEDESADADTDEEQFEYYAQVTQHPHTIIAGTPVDIVTGADLDSSVEETGASFGVVFENATVPEGTLWKNRNTPEGFDTASEFNDLLRIAIEGDDMDYSRGREVTEELIEEARDRVDDVVEFGEDEDDFTDLSYDEHKVGGTDYKIADPSDRDANVQEVDGTTLGIDVGGGVFSAEQVEEFDTERVMVWYGGLSGQFIGRAFDFNGRPSARYKDDGYLVKGLYQHPVGWFDRDAENFDSVPTTERRKLAKDLGRPPRVARPPVLREDVQDEEAFIELYRPDSGGNAIYTTVAFNDFDEDPDEATEIEPRYEQSPEEVLADAFDNPNEVYNLYEGEGWQDEPENAQNVTADGGDSSGASFDVNVEVDDEEVEHPTEEEVEFAETISEKIAGTGANPDDSIFGSGDDKMDLEGLVGANAEQFSVTPDVDAIRETVYENTSHLDAEDL